MKRSFLLIALLLPALAALPGCQSRMPHIPFEGRNHDRFPGAPGVGESEYRIGVGDQLKLSVRRYDEFSGNLTVDKMGRIRLPLVLEYVDALGKSIPQTENEIFKAIKPYVVGEPKVRVDLMKPNSRFVYVLGAVARPGKYPLQDERLYVREAVVRAGWPIRGEAALGRSKLVSSSADRNATREINLNNVLYKGDLTENYEIREGDIVWVPYTYLSEFTYQARLFLQPFAVLFGIDAAVNRATFMPEFARQTNNGLHRPQYSGNPEDIVGNGNGF